MARYLLVSIQNPQSKIQNFTGLFSAENSRKLPAIMFAKTILLRASLAFALALSLSTATALRAQNIAVDVANMRQELDLLRQRVGQLELNVEALQRENNNLRAKADSGAKQNYATVDQLTKSVATLNQAIKDSKADTLSRVKTEMDSLTKQFNASLADMAAKVNGARRATTTPATGSGAGRAPATAPVFSENYPKEGISYTIVSGDSIAKIAKKTGAKQQDIINANKIANDRSLMPGQVLFIPGGHDPAAAATPAAPESPAPIAPAQ